MSYGISLMLLVGACFSLHSERFVVITGTTLDCVGDRSQRTAGVEVFVFPRSAQLMNLIDGARKATDENIFDRFNRLIKYVKSTKTLARTHSDTQGLFKIEIPESDKVIVFGYMETEDNPFYWMYSEIDIGHRSLVSVPLNYCKKH
jgi:hypothetical protein